MTQPIRFHRVAEIPSLRIIWCMSQGVRYVYRCPQRPGKPEKHAAVDPWTGRLLRDSEVEIPGLCGEDGDQLMYYHILM